MELGQGEWTNNPKDLKGLLNQFLKHLNNYERIFTLRALTKSPTWMYELVEIPKDVLKLAKGGILEMRLKSKQMPKPGYCFVKSRDGKEIFRLYFDGGSERKLQIKHLKKSFCKVHAIWEFSIPKV